jgi:predicted signal transduction protein with EAL and GGDEF domain
MVGDKLLQAFALRLRRHLRKDTAVARLGGDEFAVLLPIQSQTEAEILAARLIKMASEVFVIDDYSIEIGLSIGIALAPLHDTSAQNLYAKADLALYSVKSLGRKHWRVYDEAMDVALQVNLKLEKELRTAFDEKQFELFYQPLVNARSGHVEGHEALLRWRHPEQGFVFPDTFIPIAEESGLIVAIGEWVLHEACANAAQWPDDRRVAVNVSPIQFRRHGLISAVRKALKKSGLAPNRLELEITEGVLMEDIARNMSLLSELKALGVRIALDDFGTGYSSLSYLRNFTYDKIKIDRSFIKDLGKDKNADSIIRAIIDMARSLDVMVTAEGVETFEQYRTLRDLHCDQIQGFYFGRPQPIPVWDCGEMIKDVA